MSRQLCRARRVWILVVLLVLFAIPAQAHFLWLTLDEASGTPRLTFGEDPEEQTPENLVAKLADATVRDERGAPVSLTQGTGGWTGKGSSRAGTATQHWGVVDRSGDGSGAFVLEYYAKGVRRLEDTALDLKLPVEMFARQEGNELVATVRRGGQPVAASPVHVTLPSGRTLDRTADEKGEVRFEAEGGGVYGLRARWLDSRAGTAGGKAYGEVRHYATLTFALAGAATGAAKPTEADPAAYALLKKAHDSRQTMPPDFEGFKSELVFQNGDEVRRGELVYRRKGETEVRLEGVDEPSLTWARSQILNLVGHRRGGDFSEGDGKYPLQLGPEDGNPYGRLVLVHDAAQSSYRVRNSKVTEVTRTMDGSRFTISVIEAIDADDGKYLANHFVVAYRDAATGTLQKFEGYRDAYTRINGVWLPTSRTVLEVSSTTSPVVRTLRLKAIQPLPPPDQDPLVRPVTSK